MKSEKPCKHCNKVLPLSAFGTHKKTAPNGKKYDFRRNVCRLCYSRYESTRRAKNRKPRVRQLRLRLPSPWKPKPYAEWTPEQKQAHAINTEKRRAKLALLPTGFTKKDWKAALAYFDYQCAYCDKHLTKAEQDHFVPAKLGGGYTKNNIIPACIECNRDKRAKNPIDWIAGLPNALIAYARITLYFMSSDA
jgi:phage FluMu protein Com